MKSISKQNAFESAFWLDAGNLCVRPGVTISGKQISSIQLPKTLQKGADYAINAGKVAGKLIAAPAPFGPEDPFVNAVGGFHVGLDGKIVEESIWDERFRPACPDPRGMVLVSDIFWADIYLTGPDGNSRAGVTIADGGNPPPPYGNFNFWTARDLLAARGKQLLSAAEFAIAANGVVENKTAGAEPKKTGHIKGLCSDFSLEQATGCMWTWSRDILPSGYVRLLGGSWGSSVAGPRLLLNDNAGDSNGVVGARGRCDHLILA